MTQMSLSVTENERNVTSGQRDTSSRARTGFQPMSRLSRVTEQPRDVTKECDSDSAPLRSDTVTITRDARPLHEIEIEPWPSFDEHGRDWWNVRVVGRCGSFSLGWSRRLQRFADSSETVRLMAASGRLLRATHQHLVATLGAPA